MTDNNTTESRAREILSRLTLREKTALLTGADVWHTAAYPQAELPAITMCDGPSGLCAEGVTSICFPSACALASSFNTQTVERAGELLGEEAANNGVSLVLAPAMNIKRSPLCGRNFEYYSEDPYLAGEAAYAYITGLQKHAGCCVKHFAVNNQETLRMSVDARVDERALHDIYLRPFEKAVRAEPLAVMSAYNKINGVYASENKSLLHDTLRTDWGYDGMVLSDWGAVNDVCASVKAGLSLEMPSNSANTQVLTEAVDGGALDESEINAAALFVIKTALRAAQYKYVPVDYGAHLRACADLGEECCVLLKNEENLLPITDLNQKIAVFGKGAKEPRLQGGGCANMTPVSVSNPLDALCKRFKNITYYDGESMAEVAALAGKSDVCIVFAGLSQAEESEGFDRTSISFPASQTKLIRTVCKANRKTAVVLTQGGVTELPFKNAPRAVLLTYLLGSAYGETVARLLCGEGEPSGRLPESWIARDKDASAYPYYGNYGDVAEYGEGVFVGYRMYSSAHRKVNYPFGYGLSYTSFTQSEFSVQTSADGVQVAVTVENTGNRDGKTTVQVYAKVLDRTYRQPDAELIGFTKVFVKAGERKRVELFIPVRELKRYGYEAGKRILYPAYEISVRENAVKALVKKKVRFVVPREPYTANTCVGRVLKEYPEFAEKLKPYLCLAILGNFNAQVEIKDGKATGNPMFTHVMQNMPLRALYNLTGGKFSLKDMQTIIKRSKNNA